MKRNTVIQGKNCEGSGQSAVNSVDCSFYIARFIDLNEFTLFCTETRRIDLDSEEAMKRRKQRAKKRKQQMQKQIEENKVGTLC